MLQTGKDPCPACENKAQLSTMNMTPEIIEEMAMSEQVGDPVSEEVYENRLMLCKSCPKLIGGMTCSYCGCFVQFRARHSRAACPVSKW